MNLLIVDDEYIIRSGMSDLFNWSELGYNIRLAPDGESALESVREGWPDIVVTDIYMPKMDGLELATQINSLCPRCVTILLSGYNEFTYAQEAIQVGVFRYLTKPIQKEALLNVLRDARLFIERRAYERKRIEKLQNFLEQSKPILRERFLLTLTRKPVPPSEARARASELGLDFRYEEYLYVIASCDHFSRLQLRDENALHMAMQAILQDYLSGISCEPHFFSDSSYEIDILVGFRCKTRPIFERLFAVLQEAQTYIRLYLDAIVTLGVSSLCASEEHIPKIRIQAKQALEYEPSAGSGSILFIEDLSTGIKTEQLFSYYSSELDQLISDIKNSNQEHANEIISHICSEIRGGGNTTRDQLRIITVDMAIRLQKLAVECGGSVDEVFGTGRPPLEQLTFDNLSELEEFLGQMANDLMTFMAQRRRSKNKKFVNMAKTFMNENYSLQEMNLTIIAETVFVSPAYLSQCFKQSESISCIEYLTQIRVDEAKKLLNDTTMKTYEVAQAVGYADPQYFSTIFKKSVGVSPTDYRKYNQSF